MKQGKFVPGPEPLVVPGKGLAKIQEEFEMQKEGSFCEEDRCFAMTV